MAESDERSWCASTTTKDCGAEHGATEHGATEHGATEHDATEHRATEHAHTTLGALLKRTGPLPQSCALPVARAIALALADMHSRHQPHGGLTPDNVILRSFGDGLVAELAADGAGAAHASLDSEFLAPEQLAGYASEMASDLYALGALVFFMMTGHPPFQGGPASLARMHLDASPPSLRGASPQRVTPVLDALVRECLSVLPGERRMSAADLAVAFVGIPEPPDEAPLVRAHRHALHHEAWGRPAAAASSARVSWSPPSRPQTPLRRAA